MKLNGKVLAFLKRFHDEAPKNFYYTVKNELGICKIEQLADFLEAMDDL